MNMTNYGFYRVAAAIPQVRVADCRFNIGQIRGLIRKAFDSGVEIVCFPELSVTAYTCADLFFQKTLTQEAEKAVERLKKGNLRDNMTNTELVLNMLAEVAATDISIVRQGRPRPDREKHRQTGRQLPEHQESRGNCAAGKQEGSG